MTENGNKLEKRNFRALIESDNIGRVEDRLHIIDTFMNNEEHITLEDFVKLLREKGFEYDSDFVKMCLNRWVDLGFAQKKTFEGQPPRYEHRHLGKHHDHMICTKCGKIFEFRDDEMEILQENIAADLGFYMLQHKMEIYGLCSECLEKRSILMPLSMARNGEEVIIREISGGKDTKARLTAMGFRTGDHLEVISHDGRQRIIVGHGPTRLGIGRDLAEDILVDLAPRRRARGFLRRHRKHKHHKRRSPWRFR
jgi:Fur family ferric uptake transcriptional regulator